jgi:hypothetical protein
MSGVEMLVVARALRSAGEVLGGGESGVRVAREILHSLVLPAGAEQAPKAQRQPFSKLAEIAGSPERAARALWKLQAEEIVRPAWSGAPEGAWQLDHDYLARAVLAEMRRADRWGTALDDGFAQYRAAEGSFRKQWAALLPITVQARLFWENQRGRLPYGQAVGYARRSALKPAMLLALISLLVGAGVATWSQFTVWQNKRDLTAWRLPAAVYDQSGQLKSLDVTNGEHSGDPDQPFQAIPITHSNRSDQCGAGVREGAVGCIS